MQRVPPQSGGGGGSGPEPNLTKGRKYCKLVPQNCKIDLWRLVMVSPSPAAWDDSVVLKVSWLRDYLELSERIYVLHIAKHL